MFSCILDITQWMAVIDGSRRSSVEMTNQTIQYSGISEFLTKWWHTTNKKSLHQSKACANVQFYTHNTIMKCSYLTTNVYKIPTIQLRYLKYIYIYFNNKVNRSVFKFKNYTQYIMPISYIINFSSYILLSTAKVQK